jgi:hypothetical protein
MPGLRALIDFSCAEDGCGQPIQFNLLDLRAGEGVVTCERCRQSYDFDDEFLDKLNKLRVLILAVKDAEDILGDCSVGVATANGEIKLPYKLLLTRLNTQITFAGSGKTMDFHIRVEPLAGETFR